MQAALPRLQSSSQRSLVRSLQTSAPAAAEVVVPAMGDSITEGSIAAVLKQPGDTVQEDDVIAQIETDKVTIDVKFTGKSGRISTLLVAEGDTVVVGQAVASVEEGAFGSSSSSSSAPALQALPPRCSGCCCLQPQLQGWPRWWCRTVNSMTAPSWHATCLSWRQRRQQRDIAQRGRMR